MWSANKTLTKYDNSITKDVAQSHGITVIVVGNTYIGAGNTYMAVGLIHYTTMNQH